MQAEDRTCQNCKGRFAVEPDDIAFYTKMAVPAPTWCPECRIVRRMTFMPSGRTFYRRPCDLCHTEGISIFPADYPHPVYCQKCWWSDTWDPMSYGREYDFSRPFFEQFRELSLKVPQFGPQSMHMTLVNSDYANMASYLKNCYLLFTSDYSEDSAYSTYLERSKRCMDIYMGDLCENCYAGNNLYKCFNVFFSSECKDCVDVSFSSCLRGCSDCFGCVNLRNKKYCIFNVQYSKEEYFAQLKKWDLGSFAVIQELLAKSRAFAMSHPRRYMEGIQNANVSGDSVYNSKNTFLSYEVSGCEECKYCQFLFIEPNKDCRDVTSWGMNLSNSYECMGAGEGQQRIMFSVDTWSNAMNLQYCWNMLSRNADLFGCISLRNKQYCILNKQYTKEEYEALVPKIIAHMKAMPYTDARGRTYAYGEFLPPELSPFPYNESMAQEYFPLDSARAEKEGYTWRAAPERHYAPTQTSQSLPDNIKDVPDAILQDVIACEHSGTCTHQCTTAFRIVPQELQFYRSARLPLPRLCPNCRYYELLGRRNPIRFWERQCMCRGAGGATGGNGVAYPNAANHFHGEVPCPNKFQTSYAPERPEMVYCEQCYQAETA